jgi:DNA-directed RNA polymerase specialized sigma subunit
MRDLIENYQTNINQSEKLHRKLIQLLQYNTKITASYGHNTGGSKGSVSSKVERYALRIIETEEKILALENKIYIVDTAERILNQKEKEVIDLVKIHRNKLTKIAKILGKDKDYVKHKRDTAIKKMSEYMKGGGKE